MLTIQPLIPCGHKHLSDITSSLKWCLPQGTDKEVSIYPPAEPCAVSFKITAGRVLCQAIDNRAFSKALVVNCPHTELRGLGSSWVLQGLQAVSKHLAENNWIQNPVLGRERWASDPMEGRMSRSSPQQSRDFLFFCVLFDGHTL